MRICKSLGNVDSRCISLYVMQTGPARVSTWPPSWGSSRHPDADSGRKPFERICNAAWPRWLHLPGPDLETLRLLCLASRWPGSCLELIWMQPWDIACTRQHLKVQARKFECLVLLACLVCNQMWCDGFLLVLNNWIIIDQSTI